MELIPILKIDWLNGWLLLGLLGLTEGIFFLLSPKHVVTRLFDRSGWSRKQAVFTVIGKLFALVCVVLIILTPLKLGSPVFLIGTSLVVLGLAGLVKALFDFRNTSLDQPVTRGLYKVSRHPQVFMSSVVLLGISLAIGSWPALFAFLGARLFGHYGILAEEEVCLKQYGETYRAYMEQVPRYFAFF
jgi:protein-S-isoprenylcysteine O-methyltransferase Ste14